MSGSATAAAGSPQRWGCISTVDVMRYSVTHDVTSSQQSRGARDGYLDAARACILDVGWRRTTLTEVARRAGVSRMTIYRTWPDMGRAARRPDDPRVGGHRDRPGDRGDADASGRPRVVDTVRALRDNELFVRIVELDPELLLPYLLAPARPLAGPDPRPHRGRRPRPARPTAPSAPGDPAADRPVAGAGGPRLRAQSAHTMVDDDVDRGGPRRPRSRLVIARVLAP